MMKRLLSLGAVLALMVGSVQAQEKIRECATMEAHEAQLARNPKYAERMRQIEEHTHNILKSGNYARSEVTGVITIPVVFHVVYNNATENVSDAQIQSQLDVLNEDFRALNADVSNVPSIFAGRVADSEVEFTLDQIVRVSTSTSAFGSNDAVKFSSQGGSDAISPATKMNFWVCDLSGGLLGYAQFPGGNPATDGVVVDYAYFGNTGTATAPYGLGRTGTHEVGHWLNLRHIWGDGNCNADDFVSDTPVMGGSNGGCPTFGINSCNEGTGDEPDMWMNYMDYVYDECMYMFTEGQKARMRAIFEPGGARESFIGGGGVLDCINEQAGDVTLVLNTDNYGSETSWTLTDSVGTTVASGSGYANNTTYTETFTGLVGPYRFTIFDSYGDGICCNYGNGSYELQDGNGVAFQSGGAFGTSESTVFCVTEGGGGDPGGDPDPMVSAIAMSSTSQGPWRRGVADITITSNGNPVSGASVSATWSGDATGTVSGTTNGSGVVSFTSDRARNNPSFTITINSVSATGYTYDAANSQTTGTVNARMAQGRFGAELDLLVFPNPADGMATVRYTLVQEEQVTVGLYTLAGQQVIAKTQAGAAGEGQVDFDLSGLQPGLYLVRVESQSQQQIQRLMVR